jgi:hypothetical protein
VGGDEDEPDMMLVAFDEGLVITKVFDPSVLTPWERVKRRVARRIRALWP